MKVGLDISPTGEVTNRGEVEAPADLHVLGALHVFDDGGAVRVYAVRDGAVWVVGKASSRDGVVTGTQDRAAVMVGMFDLPENVRPAVER